jgi:hypothetical protein
LLIIKKLLNRKVYLNTQEDMGECRYIYNKTQRWKKKVVYVKYRV